METVPPLRPRGWRSARTAGGCPVCGHPVHAGQTSLRIHGLHLHARCAVYRSRRERR